MLPFAIEINAQVSNFANFFEHSEPTGKPQVLHNASQ